MQLSYKVKVDGAMKILRLRQFWTMQLVRYCISYFILYSSLTALIIHPFYISFLFLHKTLMARNGLLCADVPLRNYSINFVLVIDLSEL